MSRAPSSPPTVDAAGRAVALFALLIGALWVWAVPPFMGPDEPWHLEYATHVADGRAPVGDGRDVRARLADLPPSAAQVAARFPGATHAEVRARQAELLAALAAARWYARVDWAEDPGRAVSFDLIHEGITAAAQPPGQYLLTGGLLALFPDLGPAGRVRLARLPSVLALVLAALAALHAGRALAGERAGRMAAALTLLAPPSGRMASTASNDALAVALVAGALWAASSLVRGGRARTWSALALCLGAAPFAKATALPALVLLVALPWARRSGRRPGRRAGAPGRVADGAGAPVGAGTGGGGRATGIAGLLALLGLLGLAAWLARGALATSPALPADLAAAAERVARGLSGETWRPVLGNLAGSSNWDSRPAPTWIAGLLAALAVGAAVGALRRVRGAPFDRRVALVLAALVLAQLASIVLRGAGSARYLMPAWPALAALLAAGWSRLPRAAGAGAEHSVGGAASVRGDAGLARAGASPTGGDVGDGDLPAAALAALLVCWHATALIGGVLVEERLLLGS